MFSALEPRRVKHLAAAVALAGLVIRCALALQPLPRIDRAFIPDDTYYTVAIARSIANGIGPAADGTTLTNGFQPLLAFLLVPAFRVGIGGDSAIALAVLVTAVVDGVSVWFVFRIAQRTWGSQAGVCAALLWAVSPYAIANALGGLETSLAVLLVLILVERSDGAMTVRAVAGCGALAALAWLARVDTLAVSGLTLAAVAWRRPPLRALVAGAAVFLLVLAPWFAYQWHHFHTIVPQSGAAVRTQVSFHKALYLTGMQQAAWSAGYVTTAPFGESRWWRDELFLTGGLAIALFGALWLLALVWLCRSIRRARRAEPAHLLCAFALIVAPFYTFYVPALWFFRRYLAPVEVAMTLAWGAAIGSLLTRGGLARLAGMSLLAVACISSAIAVAGWTRLDSGRLDAGLEGAKGYREPALALLAAVPDGATVGAFQSGALAYYAQPRVRVVNLDGVVDEPAHQAALDGRLLDYARDAGVRWFADWPFNRQALEFFSRQATSLPPTFTAVARGPLRGQDQAVLWRLDWPQTR